MDLPKKYDYQVSEKKWQDFWDKNQVYKFNPDSKAEVYSVDTPPPTVSGKMHMGHAFSYAQQDFMVRYKRMRGFNVFYPFGIDNNGLATERLVEKLKKVKATKMDRQEFVNLCLDTIEKELKPQYFKDWKSIAISCDWNIFYMTIDEHSRRISQRSFIDIYKKGRLYQKEAPTLWCPQCQTAIAQVEMKGVDIASTFNDIVFRVEGEDDLIIATTRPELLCSCVAVFMHPDDPKAKKYEGKQARVPLFDFEVPIMTSDKVDREKGTGTLMCCTFGDQDDIYHYMTHNLPLKEGIDARGRMTSLAGKYHGMPSKEARAQIISDLNTQGQLVKQEKIIHTVNVHERDGVEIEILHTKQWFMKYLDLKDEFLKRGKEMNWYPQFMKHRYDNWIKGLNWDWCISRQRFFGVPFPVWYCKNCNEVILATESDLPVDPLHDNPKGNCPKCKSTEFEPEKDIMDTWATSSLTPTIAAEIFKDKPVFEKLLPMNLRPQAHDIITFWLFNTVVKAHLHYDNVPFKDIAVSGWALDPKGRKMSKSLGNVVEPQEVIKSYPIDALRFWAAGSKLGEDLPYQEKDLVTGKKFVTKLWNASKFAIMNIQDYTPGSKPEKLESIDKWVLSKMHRIIKASTESFDKYEYSRTKSDVENFFWHTVCDNYLEIIKDRLYNAQSYRKSSIESVKHTLYSIFLNVNKMMAPIMPHITEEIYHLHFRRFENQISIHRCSWPEYDTQMFNEEAESAGDMAVEIIAAVRKFKSENNQPLRAPLEKLTIECDKVCENSLNGVIQDIASATKSQAVEFGKGNIKVNEKVKLSMELKK